MCKDPENGKYIFTNIEGKKAIEIKKRHFVDLINSRNNKASFESAMSLYSDIKKEWMTSGLPGVRDSHKAYEELGAVDINYEYAPGLKFPGDPDCKDPNELDGCLCTIVYDFD